MQTDIAFPRNDRTPPHAGSYPDHPQRQPPLLCRNRRRSHFPFPSPLQCAGSGSGKPIKYCAHHPIKERDHSHRLRGREVGPAVAKDAPVSDPCLATRRNSANVGLKARKAIFDVYDVVRGDALARQGVRGAAFNSDACGRDHILSASRAYKKRTNREKCHDRLI